MIVQPDIRALAPHGLAALLDVEAAKRGRPRIEPELADLIRRMTQENPRWGHMRVLGERRKLGYTLSLQTVRRYRPPAFALARDDSNREAAPAIDHRPPTDIAVMLRDCGGHKIAPEMGTTPAGTAPPLLRGLAGLTALPRDLFRGGLAGLLCGVVFFGLGGRLVMRVSALLNPERRGVRTENGNAIGDITLEGTVELVLFGGVLGGLLAGFIWVIVRDWLPAHGARRVLLAALAAASLGSFGMLTEENVDFRILAPAWLHLAMFLLLIGGAGAAIAVADPALDRVLPRGAAASWLYAALTFPVGMVALAVMTQALLARESLLSAVALALLLVLALDLLRWRARYLSGSAPDWLQPAGVAAVTAACAVAALHFAIEAVEILRDA